MNSSATPNFIPSTEELSKLERDLRFRPSTTERPAVLTVEQVAGFDRDGYLAGIRIFDEEEITASGVTSMNSWRGRWPQAATATLSARHTSAMGACTIS